MPGGDDLPGSLLVHEDAQGRRLVLCAYRNDEGSRETAFRFARSEGVSVFYWLEGPLSYALAGEMDRSDLLTVAEAVYRQIAI